MCALSVLLTSRAESGYLFPSDSRVKIRDSQSRNVAVFHDTGVLSLKDVVEVVSGPIAPDPQKRNLVFHGPAGDDAGGTEGIPPLH